MSMLLGNPDRYRTFSHATDSAGAPCSVSATKGDATSIVLASNDCKFVRDFQLFVKNMSLLSCVGIAQYLQAILPLVVCIRPDLLILDFDLVCDQQHLVGRIKECLPDTEILLTGTASPAEILAALSVGANGYCFKRSPVKRWNLAIHAVASGAAWLESDCMSPALRRSYGESTIRQSAPCLSKRELEVLGLMAGGLKNPQIADRLIVSKDTVKTHVKHIMEKLNVNDRTQAVIRAMRLGLI